MNDPPESDAVAASAAEPADGPAEVALLSCTPLSNGFRPLEHHEIELPGDPQPLDREVLRSGACVALIAVDLARDRLVMLRQFRLPAHLATGNGDLVEFVAGRLEPGEDPVEAVHREAREEIGLAIGSPFPIFRFLPTPGITDELATFFVAAVDSGEVPERAGLATENETTRPFTVSIDAALAAMDRGAMLNGYTRLGLQWLALNRGRLPLLLSRPD